nr:8190_t:CDS:2 [Entrophospora candida]
MSGGTVKLQLLINPIYNGKDVLVEAKTETDKILYLRYNGFVESDL